MPNQKRFSFRWVFEHALESLGLGTFFKLTEMFMKDGDPQQHNEIMRAMKSYMTKAHDAGCGWHVVHQGWKRDCPGIKSVSEANQGKYETVRKHIKAWIYSWMRPGYCETKEEFEISKELLFRFVTSQSVFDTFDKNQKFITRIKQWIQKVITQNGDLIVFYKRKHKRHFDTMCASGHEATNFGLKNHSIPVKATASLSTTAKTLGAQANLKTADLEREIYLNMTKPIKSWSDYPTAEYVPPFAEGLIHAVMSRVDAYIARHIGYRDFEVVCTTLTDPFLTDSTLNSTPIPKFHRTRRLTVNDNGINVQLRLFSTNRYTLSAHCIGIWSW